MFLPEAKAALRLAKLMIELGQSWTTPKTASIRIMYYNQSSRYSRLAIDLADEARRAAKDVSGPKAP